MSFELGEDEQPLVGIVEEPLLPHDFVEAGELGLLARCLDGPSLSRELSEFGNLLADLIGVSRPA